MRAPVLLALLVGGWVVLVAQTPPAAASEATVEIPRLIRQLGSDDPALATAAEEGLYRIGPAALPALRKALLSASRATSDRAQRIVNRMLNLSPEVRDALRADGQEAFAKADPEAMVAAYWRLAVALDATLDDCLWLGHAHQLAGRWDRAVEAYLLAVERIDAMLKPRPAPAPEPPELGEGVRRTGLAPIFGAKGGHRPADESELVRKKATLLVWIGLLQREQLRDAKAACATFAAVAGGKPTADVQLNAIRDRALDELVVAHEQAGQIGEAIKTCRKIYQANRQRHESRKTLGRHADPLILARLVRALPAGSPSPNVPGLIVLSEKDPTIHLDMEDQETSARTYREGRSANARRWYVAFCPPRGKEFAAMDFAVDIEQLVLRYGGHFRCWTSPAGRPGRVGIGSIGWPGGAEPGRLTCTGRFDIPPGSGPVQVEVCTWPGKFNIHSLKVAAELRPRNPLAASPATDVWMQNEVLPPGGNLSRNGEPMHADTASSGLEPGPYTFVYEIPGRKDAFYYKAELVPGGRYGLFVNLDSPFQWSLTKLRHFDTHPPAAASIAPLPDGRWLAAYAANGAQIMLSASRDLTEWESPWPLPHNSALFKNISPTLLADEKGNVHLTYFSNRLYLDGFESSAGYRMWMARSRDGRSWSAPRPIPAGVIGGWPINPVCMLRGPKGRHWMFWGDRAASAATPADIAELRPAGLPKVANLHVCNTHVAIDPTGRMHMVFDNFGRGIHYTHSANGADWAMPICLAQKIPGRSVSHGQLILHRGRARLIYSRSGGAYLCPMVLGERAKLAPAVKIANHVVPLNGSRACLTPDGRAVLFAGTDTVWALAAKTDQLFGKPPSGSTPDRH